MSTLRSPSRPRSIRARLLHPCLCSLGVSLLALSSGAQSVLVVDAAGGAGSSFTELQPAVDAAAEGDTILVRSGSYAPFLVVGKSLSLHADAGANVQLLPSFGASAPLVDVRDLGPAQAVTVRGLLLRASAFASPSGLVRVEDCLGPVWLEDCTTLPTPLVALIPSVGAVVEDCAGVTFTRCALQGSLAASGPSSALAPGLQVTRSNVALFETVAIGAEGIDQGLTTPAERGGDGVVVEEGVLFASASDLFGGSGGAPRLGSDGVDGGAALVLGPGSVARLLDVDLSGGDGSPGNGPNTLDGAAGAPSEVDAGATLDVLEGAGRTFVSESPVRAGVEPLGETFGGEAGDVAVLAYSLTGPLQPFYLAAGRGALVLAPGLVLLPKGTLDAGGTLTTAPPSVALSAGTLALTVHLQGAMLSASGDGVFLSSPSTLLLLDPSL